MNILLIGSGGREHTLAWKIIQSDNCEQLYIAPGNGGTAYIGKNIAINVSDFNAVRTFIVDRAINLLIVGPEDPLVNGIRDHLDDLEDLIIVGPGRAGAALEGSKSFAKSFMSSAGIPTANAKTFDAGQVKAALNYLSDIDPPYVLKADGLAAGKGVIITSDYKEARNTVESMLNGQFGQASKHILIEQFLTGVEYSVFVLCDGKNWVLLPEAKDYKQVGEGNTGPNTGGMGAISPVPFFTAGLKQKTIDKVIQPTVDELIKRGIDYKGFIFFGLINVNGEPYVIEYNCRMGDPETEVVIPRLKNDLVSLFKHMHNQTLDQVQVQFDDKFTTTVMLCSGGYPGAYEKQKPIAIDGDVRDTLLFHAGTTTDDQGQLITNGGRVMAITSQSSDDITSALVNSMLVAEKVNFEGKFYRKDIGFDL